MNVSFALDNIDDIRATLTATMAVSEWRKLHELLQGQERHSTDVLSRAILDLLCQIDSRFYASAEAV